MKRQSIVPLQCNSLENFVQEENQNKFEYEMMTSPENTIGNMD
jgi:hypothetical protein